MRLYIWIYVGARCLLWWLCGSFADVWWSRLGIFCQLSRHFHIYLGDCLPLCDGWPKVWRELKRRMWRIMILRTGYLWMPILSCKHSFGIQWWPTFFYFTFSILRLSLSLSLSLHCKLPSKQGEDPDPKKTGANSEAGKVFSKEWGDELKSNYMNAKSKF